VFANLLNQVSTLSSHLERPGSLSAAAGGGADASCDTIATDRTEDGYDRELSDSLFFKVVVANPSRKKGLKVGLGCGGRISDTHILVTVHTHMQGFGEEHVISLQAASSDSANAIFLADGWRGSPGTVQETFQGFAGQQLLWTLPSLDLPQGCTDADLCRLIDKFMSTGSHFGGSQDSSLRVAPTESRLVKALTDAGFVAEAGSKDRWRLTAAGTQALVACARLEKPFKVGGCELVLPTPECACGSIPCGERLRGSSASKHTHPHTPCFINIVHSSGLSLQQSTATSLPVGVPHATTEDRASIFPSRYSTYEQVFLWLTGLPGNSLNPCGCKAGSGSQSLARARLHPKDTQGVARRSGFLRDAHLACIFKPFCARRIGVGFGSLFDVDLSFIVLWGGVGVEGA
jgi:hypothetical protein